MQTIWFTGDLAALFMSAGARELLPIAEALDALRPELADDPVVRHNRRRPDRWPDLLDQHVRAFAAKVERKGPRLSCPIAELLAAAIEHAHGRVPPRPTTLGALEDALLEHVTGSDRREPLIQLACAIAQLRRTRIDRARRLGFTIEEVSMSENAAKGDASTFEAIKDFLASVAGGIARDPDTAVKLIPIIGDGAEIAAKELGRANILVAGQTGVGKSSLINAVFGRDVAKTGAGKPVTERIESYEPPNRPIRLYDTVGLEAKDYDKTRAAIITLINECNKSGEPKDRLHILWLCISETSARVQDAERDLVKLARANHLPVIVALTKAVDEAARFDDTVRGEVPEAAAVVRVLASKMGKEEPFGVETLVVTTLQLIEEAAKAAFIAAQQVRFDLKRQSARSLPWQYALAAGAAGVVPVALASVPAVMAVKLKMAAAICARMGLPLDQRASAEIAGAITAIMAGSGAVALAAAQAIKLVPGLGMVAGGAAGAVAAAGSAYVIGHALIEYLYRFGLDHGRMPEPGEIKGGLVEFWKSGKAGDVPPPEPQPA